jgi:hypothetical protein
LRLTHMDGGPRGLIGHLIGYSFSEAPTDSAQSLKDHLWIPYDRI